MDTSGPLGASGVSGLTNKQIVRLVEQSYLVADQRVRELSGYSSVLFNDTWKPVITKKTNQERGEITMQKLFTIEIRVDFRDEDKIPLMQKAIQQAARHVYAQAALLGDAVKPQVVIYGHDYFTGHSDIPLFDDDVSTGDTAITEASNSPHGDPTGEAKLTTGSPTATPEPAPEGFSKELLDSLK